MQRANSTCFGRFMDQSPSHEGSRPRFEVSSASAPRERGLATLQCALRRRAASTRLIRSSMAGFGEKIAKGENRTGAQKATLSPNGSEYRSARVTRGGLVSG